MLVKANSQTLDEVKHFLASIPSKNLGHWEKNPLRAIAMRKKSIIALNVLNKEMAAKWETFVEKSKGYSQEAQELQKELQERIRQEEDEKKRKTLTDQSVKELNEFMKSQDEKLVEELKELDIEIGTVTKTNLDEEGKPKLKGGIPDVEQRVIIRYESDVEGELSDKIVSFIKEQLDKNTSFFWFEDKMIEACEAFGMDFDALLGLESEEEEKPEEPESEPESEPEAESKTKETKTA